MNPDNLKYSETHEWVKEEKDIVTIGLSPFAMEQLGDIVFLELPKKGDKVKKGDSFGSIESVKTVSELNAPVSGTITEVNDELVEKLDLLQNEPVKQGWLIKVKISDKKELSGLMDNKKYTEYTKSS